MITKDVENAIKTIIQTLCQTKRVDKEVRALKMHQFQQWLVTAGHDDLAIFRAAEQSYAGISASHSIFKKLENHDGRRLTPSNALRLLIDEGPAFVKNLDLCLSGGRSSFFSNSPLDPATRAVGDDKLVASINLFTNLCLQLSQAATPSYKGTAKKLYAHAATHNPDLVKDIERHRTARRSCLAFLYVAERFSQLLHRFDDPIIYYSYLEKQARHRGAFQRYFAQCAYVQNVLAHGSQLSGDLIAKWAGIDVQEIQAKDTLDETSIEAAEQLDIERPRKPSKGRLPGEMVRA